MLLDVDLTPMVTARDPVRMFSTKCHVWDDGGGPEPKTNSTTGDD